MDHNIKSVKKLQKGEYHIFLLLPAHLFQIQKNKILALEETEPQFWSPFDLAYFVVLDILQPESFTGLVCNKLSDWWREAFPKIRPKND